MLIAAREFVCCCTAFGAESVSPCNGLAGLMSARPLLADWLTLSRYQQDLRVFTFAKEDVSIACTRHIVGPLTLACSLLFEHDIVSRLCL